VSGEGEYRVLNDYTFPKKMTPMLICTELYAKDSIHKTFEDFHSDIFRNVDKVILDFPCDVKYDSNFGPNQEPLSKDLDDDPFSRIDYFNKLNSLKNVIPCVSLHPMDFPEPDEAIKRFQNELDNSDKLVYSIHLSGNKEQTEKYAQLCFDALNTHARDKDRILFNLNSKHPTSTKAVEHIGWVMNQLKTELVEKTYIHVCSPAHLRRDDIPNGSYKTTTKSQKKIRFHLHQKMSTLPFRGIADFSGMDHSIPKLTKPMSRHRPVYLATDYSNSDVWGFKSTSKSKSQYKTTVYPNYIKSKHWTSVISKSHKTNCPGCSKIASMKIGAIPIESADWREIILLHHLTEMKNHL
tara:strand:+ start:191 stop:1246 length:1056 start_codon:yes stop_codon:yes gene_type:complete